MQCLQPANFMNKYCHWVLIESSERILLLIIEETRRNPALPISAYMSATIYYAPYVASRVTKRLKETIWY